jgi:hypothetical protein
MVGVAERAVELFDEYVRKPIRDTSGNDEEAAAQLVEAFRTLLPAVTNLVANHFRRVLLETAEERIDRVDEAQIGPVAVEGRADGFGRS